MAKEREWWCLCQGVYPQRNFLRHLRNLGLQILLTSNGTYSPTTFRGLVTLCVPKRKNKKVNPGKILQKDFELVCSKTALFVVLLRCLTLGKLTNWFRESKITRGYLEAIQSYICSTFLSLYKEKNRFSINFLLDWEESVVRRQNAELGDAAWAWCAALHTNLCAAFVSCNSYFWILFGQ